MDREAHKDCDTAFETGDIHLVTESHEQMPGEMENVASSHSSDSDSGIEMQICLKSIERVNRLRVMVGAEIAKHFRLGDSKRDQIQAVLKQNTSRILKRLQRLKETIEKRICALATSDKVKEHIGLSSEDDVANRLEQLVIGECTLNEVCKQKHDEIRTLKEELEKQKRRLAELDGSHDRDGHLGQHDPSPGRVMPETSSVNVASDLSESDEHFQSGWHMREKKKGCRCERFSSSSRRNCKDPALPDVSPYSGKEKEYSFENFVEAFDLKYPGQYWEDEERCALFKSKLTGELKRLQKPETQSLERLSRRAYPELDERTLSVIRADHLNDQLSHWDDSCRLQEALEGPGGDMNERLKDAAMRAERRHVALESRAKSKPPHSSWIKAKGKRFQRRSTKEAYKGLKEENCKTEIVASRDSKANKELQNMKCFRCKGTGRKARDCKSAAAREPKSPMSLSVRVKVLGRDRKALLDTGSEVLILPSRVLKEAMSDGIDIDAVVKGIPVPKSLKITDVSGRVMNFLTAVDIDVADLL
ncbi:hypothetical protein COOONC_00338 [Cooperia oncophora]